MIMIFCPCLPRLSSCQLLCLSFSLINYVILLGTADQISSPCSSLEIKLQFNRVVHCEPTNLSVLCVPVIVNSVQWLLPGIKVIETRTSRAMSWTITTTTTGSPVKPRVDMDSVVVRFCKSKGANKILASSNLTDYPIPSPTGSRIRRLMC